MVVDDNPQMQNLLRRVLELEKYGAVVAQDGPTALSLFQAERPDLVILDVVMPLMDGFEVLRRLRQESRVPVIMITSRAEPSCFNHALELGADDYIIKPFAITEFTTRVKARLKCAGTSAEIAVGDGSI
jgi:two-component system KDP operon response regulator KdpE